MPPTSRGAPQWLHSRIMGKGSIPPPTPEGSGPTGGPQAALASRPLHIGGNLDSFGLPMRRTPRTALATAVVLVLLPPAVLAARAKGRVVNTQELRTPVWNEAQEPNAHRYTFREPAASGPRASRGLRGH